jgi:glycine cleavage system H protein
MSEVPDDLKYTAEHEWARVESDGGTTKVRVGITDYAQAQLGDVVFVDLPAVGDPVTAGTPCGEVESTKSVSELYAPVSGEVVAVNGALEGSPELVNSGPYGDGWMFEVRAECARLDELLDAAAYRGLTDD